MALRQLTDDVYVLRGPVNLGLVRTTEGLVAIDSGLDQQSAKKLLKAAAELQQDLVAVINTHGHADHFGGNDTLQKRTGARVYAPVGEADVIRRPAWEPQYLWNGAEPLPELMNKFLHAAPSPVDEEFQSGDRFIIGNREFQSVGLSGHSHDQAGILVDGVLFCADAYLDPGVTDKHGLPYFVNYEDTLHSANHVTSVDAVWWVPAHGEATQDPTAAVKYFVERIEQVYAWVLEALNVEMKTLDQVKRMTLDRAELQTLDRAERKTLDRAERMTLDRAERMTLDRAERKTLDQLVSVVCKKLGFSPRGAGPYMLVRTPVSAFITYGVQQGSIEVTVDEGILWFQRGS